MCYAPDLRPHILTSFIQHQHLFHHDEAQTILISLATMYSDLQQQRQDLLSEAHLDYPAVVQQEKTDHAQRGRPMIHIDPDFLEWAYTQRSISGIARFLGVHRHTVKRCLIDYGIIPSVAEDADTSEASDGAPMTRDTPHDGPSNNTSSDAAPEVAPSEQAASDPDDLLEPDITVPDQLPPGIHHSLPAPVHPRGTLTDSELDHILVILRSHYHRAGLRMLDGMLRALGHHISRNRVRASLLRIDPVRRVFERIRIRRREYRVAGPNALWHHDGQHGL